MAFRRFLASENRWGGEFSFEQLIWLHLGGHVGPDDPLWCARLTTIREQIPLATMLLPNGWTANAFEQTAASVRWRVVTWHSDTSGPRDSCTLNDLRMLHEWGQLAPSTYVSLCTIGANAIPLRWLLEFPIPVAPRPPQHEVPWGKIVFGAAALFGAVYGIGRILEDPEPRAIRRVAAEKEAEGAVVFADVRGYRRPPILNGRIPDVVAYYDDGFIEAIEMENERSISRSHAAAQIDDLAVWASRSGRRSFSVEIVEGGRGGKS